jgi:hypothetical protein
MLTEQFGEQGRRPMPSGAVRLSGAAAVTAAAAGVVTAEPSWMAERRRRGNPSGVGPAQPPVAVAVEDVRTPDTPLVACPRPLSAGRTSVHWVGRTSGVHATGVHATGAILVSGRTRLR